MQRSAKGAGFGALRFMSTSSGYRRYHLRTREAPDVVSHPSRFRVRVRRTRLLRMVLHELLFEYRRHPEVALSRPCVYGVFGRVVGGLAPIHGRCVGCLRCSTQYPGIVSILPNPERERLGDSYLQPDQVDTILYEARSGSVPVRGAGYRGRFGGPGWEGMWTDMSEIVRPTRDGIHGREFISTDIDLGGRPAFLKFSPRGEPIGPLPEVLTLPIPFLFDPPPESRAADHLLRALAGGAKAMGGLAILPLRDVIRLGLAGDEVAPLISLSSADSDLLDRLPTAPLLLELDGWDPARFGEMRQRFPSTVVTVRLPADTELVPLVKQGAASFHLTADYHGRVGELFVLEVIRQAHDGLVREGLREQVTLIGSGGIVAAEHVPKAILCGLDAVALDTAVWVALQARLQGECRGRASARLSVPKFPQSWAVQRLQNLVASWRDQLLEILGAMGLREVRRLRGEIGRCMFQSDLEAEAFGDIDGFAA
jgi:hypothetical protein